MAWLYAVPYERILDPLGATHANLWTLGLVSVWRVAILIRVFVVLLGFTAWGAAITVLVIADAIALFSLRVLPVSVLQLMGGVRVSDRESLIQSFGMNIFCIGGCSLPILLLMTFGILAATRVRWAAPTSLSAKSRRPSLPLWLVCFWSLAVWPLILPMTQPEQQLRSHAEKLLINHDVEGSLAFMSAHQQDEFPPHWDPPIRQRGLDFLCKTFNAMEKQPAAPWVRALYVNMLREELQYWFRYENHHEKDKLSTLLNTVPEATAIVAEFRAIDEDRARAIFKPHVENWEMSRPEASR
ncbi:MAG: hypothetical protein HY040_21435 [Planctomycetes bacterium]|nr:hypothetical protein [Planctomycetota bacterium]